MSGAEAELRIEPAGQPRVTVGRYSLFTRINHWTLALSFLLLAVSGAALFHPSLFWLSVLFGGGPMLRWLHPVFGVVLMLAWLVMFDRYWRFNLPENTDIAWLKSTGAVLRGEEEKVPEVGRYNAGQKLVFWSFTLLVPALFLTGLVMWDVYFFDWTTIPQKRLAVLAHALLAVGMITVWIVHAYAAIWVRGTIRAMTRGYVTGGWAFRHHRKWLRELAAGRRSPPSPSAG
jgi:formate dehydrogenase subunit gamma